MIKSVFPKLEIGWYSVLREMLIDDGFSNKKFMDAVRNLVKTCPYPEPAIANILSFDKKMKIYTHNEVTEKYLWDEVTAIDIGINQARWAKKEDVKNYGVKEWTPPKQQK